MFERTPTTVARWSVAFVFLYHGLVPKLILVHDSEISLVMATPTMGLDLSFWCASQGLPSHAAVLTAFWQHKWPYTDDCPLCAHGRHPRLRTSNPVAALTRFH